MPRFEPGNVVALLHGANSQRLVAEKAELVRREMIAENPWLSSARYASDLAEYCRAAATADLLQAHCATLARSEKAPPKRVVEQATQASRRVVRLAEQLAAAHEMYERRHPR